MKRNTLEKFILSALAGMSLIGMTPAFASSYGDHAVTSQIPGTGATNLGKAEDAAHTSADTGVMNLGVVNVSGAARAGADGDYVPPAMTKEGFTIVAPDRSFAYSATTLLTTPAAATTDIAELRYVSKVLRVKKVYVTYISASGSLVCPTYLIKRGTAQDSGGTSTDITACPFDSNNAAATGVLRRYTANPTLGTTVANVTQIQMVPKSAAVASEPGVCRQVLFDAAGGQGIVLRANTESLAVNFNGTIPPNTTPQIEVTMEWTEDQ